MRNRPGGPTRRATATVATAFACLCTTSSAPRAGGQQRGGLGDAGSADGVGDDGARGRHGDHARSASAVNPRSGSAERLETRLARLPIECRDLGDGRAREPGAVERGVEEIGHGVRRRARRRADTGDERRWVQRHRAGRRLRPAGR